MGKKNGAALVKKFKSTKPPGEHVFMLRTDTIHRHIHRHRQRGTHSDTHLQKHRHVHT